MSEREFCVSSDSLGVLGNPKKWRDVYGFLEGMKNFAGIEAIGWSWLKSSMASEDGTSVKIKGVHGRVSRNVDWLNDPKSKITQAVINEILVPTFDLVTKFPNQNYVLIHSTEARIKESELIKMNGKTCPNQTLFIENEPTKDSLKTTAEQVVAFARTGKNTGIMMDIGHHLFGLGEGQIVLKKDWETLIQDISDTTEYLNQNNDNGKIKIGMHLPVGDNSTDSINIDQITKAMWSDLCQLFDKHPQILLVIENQQNGIDLVHLTPTQARKQRHRNNEKVGILIENGIIQE